MNQPVVAVHLAKPTDLDSLSRLLAEMEQHYHGASTISLDSIAPHIQQALFGARPIAEALIAIHHTDIVGVAIVTPFFPARHLTTGLYLTDLYTTISVRGQGVGRVLMVALAQLAIDRGYSRIDWSTNLENSVARALYQSLNPTEQLNWRYQLDGEALRVLASARV